MANPIIIFGAGASFDYAPPEQIVHPKWQPPLTFELFAIKRFQEVIDAHSGDISRVASHIQSFIRTGVGDFETLLAEYALTAGEDAGRQRQVNGIQFYLRDLFLKISKEYVQTTNNYSTLVGRLEHYHHRNPDEKITFVTFNYDTLLDRELRLGRHIDQMLRSYISDPFRLIKLHGSADWVYVWNGDVRLDHEVNMHGGTLEALRSDPWMLIRTKQHPPIFESIHTSETLQMKHPNRKDHTFYFSPAIAIPVAEKSAEQFVCPDEHRVVLERAIADSTSIIVIGWKAGDPALLDLLRKNSPKNTDVLVVSQNLKSARPIADHVAEATELNVRSSDTKGFSSFLGHGDLKKMLNE